LPVVADLISLDEAAKYIPGADAETLKRKARAGKLRVYRIGKAFSTTRADLQEMIEACLVAPKVPDSAGSKLRKIVSATSRGKETGLSSMELASAALDATLESMLQSSRPKEIPRPKSRRGC
jgi:hypothetical protein